MSIFIHFGGIADTGRDRDNRILPVASGQGLPETVTFHTDATIYLGAFSKGHAASFEAGEHRRIFIYMTEGNLAVDDTELARCDQARIDPERPLTLRALADARFVLIDVPSCRGWGYERQTLSGSRL